MDSSAAQKPDLKTEAIAGITTFFTMSYIVVVNPQIIFADGKTGRAFSGVLPSIIAILFTDLFDSISTFIGVPHAADLLDQHGHPRNLRDALIVDSLATMGAGLAGTSSGTAYIESIAGISMGGRTGLT